VNGDQLEAIYMPMIGIIRPTRESEEYLPVLLIYL
jgi:hypothetical protein